MEHDESEL
jgi:hypothetical protein